MKNEKVMTQVERMTIDEAIAQEREKAKEIRENIIDGDNLEPYESYCNAMVAKSVEEQEQLAEWLERLKAYESSDFIKNLQTLVYNQGYNKAIDNFKEELFKNSETARPVGWLGYSEIVTCEKIYDIAEQLMAGGTDETI